MQLPAEPTKRADEFEAAFNRIDTFLRKETGRFDREKDSFSSVLSAYEQRHGGMYKVVSLLRDYARFRNAMVHGRVSPVTYFAFPHEETLRKMLLLERQLTQPLLADNAFLREVIYVEPNQSVRLLLDMVREHEYTQFPVYSTKWQFDGMVTSIGLTRWFASRPGGDESLIDLADHDVSEIVAFEEARENSEFLPRTVPVVDVVHAFRENPALEAVIFTNDGHANQTPIGIATQWDISSRDWDAE